MENGKKTLQNQSLKNNINISISELLYLCFFGMMFFAKGIGLYDGQGAYKVFLVLAFLCIVVKMCITKHSVIEWAIIFLLLALATIVYRVSGDKGALIYMVMVVAIKGVSVKRVFQTGLVVWSVAMGGRFLLSLLSLEHVRTAVQTKSIFGDVLRYFMGFPHPNVLHVSYLVLTALIIYAVWEDYNWRHVLWLLFGNLFLFFYSYSFTGGLAVILYILLSYYVKKIRIGRFQYFLVSLVFPLYVLFSIVLPVVLQGKYFEYADKFFNNRINFARHFLTIGNMSFFGNKAADITTDVITMDNSLVLALVIYGVPIFLLICAGYIGTVSAYIKKRKNMELVMICCFFVAGITEPFLFNTSFKNLPLLFVGEQFFLFLANKFSDQKQFTILSKYNRNVQMPIKYLGQIAVRIRTMWDTHGKLILRAATVAALLLSIGAGFLYEPNATALAVQKGNVLVYERIRVILTAFLVGELVFAIIMGTSYGFIDYKKNKTD
ncbi:hypothetical protein EDD76_104134 [Kineothrix alysoides]|uniref:Uncharacterized protein n=1 Tax=Kineothrix alysoides TaxID=1469948 RepID=A0A4V2QC96_9FIRM|nr:hypothetical protein [Kineothrix alysoides]TCL59397.1 hypothetical protein EDD76_104134 [Kineothrix alysoides]